MALISPSRRLRRTPFSDGVEAAGDEILHTVGIDVDDADSGLGIVDNGPRRG